MESRPTILRITLAATILLILTAITAPAEDETERALGAKYIPLISSNNIALPFPNSSNSGFDAGHDAFGQAMPYATQITFDFDIPVTLNTDVWEELDALQRQPGRVRTVLERGAAYIPVMKKALFEEGCPQDMVFLAMIESSFSPTARSVMDAAGLWQFMESTGKTYGLEKNGWIDERLDIVKSSHAAARFLLDLYDRFGDWSLVLAAYNAGPGTVGSAIKKQNTTDFWKIADTSHLRAETKSFVPRFYATLVIAKYPERFGLSGSNKDKAPEEEYEMVKAPPLTDIYVVAKLSGAPFNQLMILNAQYLQECTTPDPDGDWVRVPKGYAKGLQSKLDALDETDRNSFLRYSTKRRDTLERIARVFHIKPKMILDANGLRSRREIREGLLLTIPVRKKRPEPTVADRENPAVRKTSSGMYCIRYSVGAGETLWEIAHLAGVDVEELCNWNDVHRNDAIQPGQSLIIYCDDYDSARTMGARGNENQKRNPSGSASSSRPRYHTVKQGESLNRIAAKYKVTPGDISNWNNISDPRRIRVGQQLKIYR